MANLTPELLRGALAGQSEALRQLVAAASPIVHARVVWATSRGRSPARRTGQDIEDLSQEVFAGLFDNNARVLRQWDPDRGLSLGNFIGLFATRATITILRSGRKNPWRETPTERADIERALTGAAADPESRVAARQTLEEILDRLYTTLSPSALEFFHRAYVLEQSVEEMCTAMDLGPEAVYARRSRLKKAIRTIVEELASESEARSRRPDQDEELR